MIPFPFNENRFSFFVADHLLVGHLCTNPKSDSSLLLCLKVKQCSTSEIGDAPLYNLCSLPIQVMITGPLPAPSKCKSGRFNTWGQSSTHRTTLWSWWSGRPHHATSRHLTSSKSAWKPTPKGTWMCWRVWWSPGTIRWPVADPRRGSRTRRRPTSPKRPRLGFRRSAMTLYPSLTAPPSTPDLNPRDYFVWSYVENITNMISHNTKASLIAAIRRVFAEYSPISRRRLWKRHAPISGSVSRRWLRLKAATLNKCPLYNIIKFPKLIFFNKSFKIKL